MSRLALFVCVAAQGGARDGPGDELLTLIYGLLAPLSQYCLYR